MPLDIQEIKREAQKDLLFQLHLLSDEERRWYDTEMDKIYKTYGYEVNQRQGGVNAIREYILANTDYKPEDVVDLSRMPHEELMGYIQGFVDMMDSTRRPATECAKDLARMHKTFMGKMKEYRVPDIRVDNIEYLAKQYSYATLLKSLYIEHSQDLQDLRASEIKTTHKDITDIRRAYEEEYPLEEAGKDEDDFGKLANDLPGAITEAVERYVEKPKETALYLYYVRDWFSKNAGKTVGELSFLNNLSGRNLPSFVPTVHAPGENEEYKKYNDGITGHHPAEQVVKETYPAFLETTLEVGNQTVPESVRNNLTSSKSPLITYIGSVPEDLTAYLPQDDPDNLLKLPADLKDIMETAYMKTFYKAYHGFGMLAAKEAGMDSFDLIGTNEGTVRELVGNKYDGCTPGEKELALKLETIRLFCTHPEGLICRFVKWVRNPGTNTYNTQLDENVITAVALPKNYTYNFAALPAGTNPVTNQTADRFFNGQDGADIQNLLRTGRSMDEKLKDYFSNDMPLLRKNNLDIYDCIYIGNQTVNEIFEENFADRLSDIPNVAPYKSAIIAAAGFNPQTPVFMTNISAGRDGKTDRHIVPVLFDGPAQSVTLAEAQKRTGTEDAVRQSAAEILKQREDRYNDLEAVKNDLLQKAAVKVVDANNLRMMKDFGKRLDAVEFRANLVSPVSGKVYTDIVQRMNALRPGLDNAVKEYRKYEMAANMTDHPRLKEELLNHANELKNKKPIRDYEIYLTGLELTFNLKKSSDIPAVRRGEISSFYEEKTGEQRHFFPNDYEIGNFDTGYRPVSVSVGNAAEVEKNTEKIRNYLNFLYCERHLWNGNRESFADYVLIDGQPAKEKIRNSLRENPDLKNNATRELYLKEIASAAAKALSQGKKVDLYVAPCSSAQSLSTAPIHVLTADQVELTEEQTLNFENNQRNGHNRLISQFRTVQVSEEEIIRTNQRIANNADRYYNQLVSQEYYGYKSGNSMIFNIEDRYFPIKPVPNVAADQRRVLKEGEPRGKIRAIRNSPISYLISRLCEESEKRVALGQQGFTPEDIVSVNKLPELKQQIADEYMELCRNYDTVNHAINLFRASEAARKYLDRINPPENFKLDDGSMERAFSGPIAAINSVFNDNYQELCIGDNRDLLVYHNVVASKKEFESIMDRQLQRSTIQKAYMDEARGWKLATMGYDYYPFYVYRDSFYRQWAEENTVARNALGLPPLGEMIDTGEHYFIEFEDGQLCDYVANADEALKDKLANGTAFDTIFVDVNKAARIHNNLETGPIDSCITIVNNLQQKKELRKQSLEKRIDQMEEKAIAFRLDETLNDREALFAVNNAAAGQNMALIRRFRNVDELNQQELERAGEIYDRIFGKIHSRQAVRDYLQNHPEVTEFDLFYIGDKTVKEFLHGDEQQQQLTELQKKAEILRILTEEKLPLSRRLIRPAQANAQAGNQNPAAEEMVFEDIIPNSLLNRVAVQVPYLANLGAYKQYTLQRAEDADERNIINQLSEDEWKIRYKMHLYDTTERLISEDRMVDDSMLKNAENITEPQDYIFARLKTVFGPEPVFIKDWVKPDINVYSQNRFMELQDMGTGSFSDAEFTLTAYMASLNPPHNPQNMPNWTVNFNAEGNPQNIDRWIGSDIKQSREAAAAAIGAFDAQNNPQAMADIFSNGIRHILAEAGREASISRPEGNFAHYAYLLAAAEVMLMNRQDIMDALDLNEAELNRLVTALKIRELQKNKANAEKILQEERDGKIQLAPEEKKNYLADISLSNYVAELWHQNANHNDFPQNVMDLCLSDQELENKKNHLLENIDRINKAKTYILNVVDIYKEQKAKAELDEKHRIALPAMEYSMKCKIITEMITRFKTANAIFGRSLSDEQVRRMMEVLRRKYGINTLNIDSVDDLARLDVSAFDNLSYQQVEAFYDVFEDEVDRSSFHSDLIDDIIEGFKTPTEKAETEEGRAEMSECPEEDSQAIDALINRVDNRAGDEEQKQADRELLQGLKAKLSVVKQEFRNYFSKYYNTNEVSSIDFFKAKDTPGSLKGGAFENLWQETNTCLGKRNTEMDFVAPGRGNAIQDLRDHPVAPSEDVCNKIIHIAELMEQSGLIKPDGNVPMEENGKVFAYHKLLEAKGNLRNAMLAVNPNAPVTPESLARIRACNTEYNAAYGNIRNIQRAIKEAFPDLLTAPGNVDSNRNGMIPVEFMADANVESVMNGIFLMANRARQIGKPVSEVIRNPFKASEEYIDRKLNERGVDAMTGNLPVCQAFNMLYELRGDIDGGYHEAIGELASTTTHMIRPVEVLPLLESDADKRIELQREIQLAGSLAELKVNYNNLAKFSVRDYVRGRNDLDEAAYERFKNGIKTALVEGTPLKRKHLPVVNMDENYEVKPDAINYDRSLQAKNRYTALLNTYNQNLEAAQESETDAIREILEEVLFDYLTAHPEDMEKREYRNLERTALRAAKAMDITTNRSAQYLQFKENFKTKQETMYNELKEDENELNKKLTELQTKRQKEINDRNTAVSQGQNPEEFNRRISEIENQIRDAADARIIELSMKHHLRRVTDYYLINRYNQLNELKQNPGDTVYRQLPQLVAANGPMRDKDCRFISDVITGKTAKDWPEELQSLKKFKEWKHYEEVSHNVAFEDELSPDEWKLSYTNEIKKYAINHFALPEGIPSIAQITAQMEERKAKMQTDKTNEKTVSNVKGDAGVQAENYNYGAGNADMMLNLANEMLRDRISNEFNTLLVNDGKKQVLGDKGSENGDFFKEDIYRLSAQIISYQIVRDNNGTVPGGISPDELQDRLAANMNFRSVMTPILDKVYEEKMSPVQGHPAEFWTNKFIEMLNDRSIQNAFIMQTEASKRETSIFAGVYEVQKLVNSYAGNLNPAEAQVQGAGVEARADVAGAGAEGAVVQPEANIIPHEEGAGAQPEANEIPHEAGAGAHVAEPEAGRQHQHRGPGMGGPHH